VPPVDLSPLRARRPHRADAARNFDALVAAARDVLTEYGVDAPMDEVARRAGVSIATLYRNFPTREQLLENAYVSEVEAVCRFADMDLIAKTKFKFAVDAMYGSGRGVLSGIFAARGVQYVAIRQELNPLFPGINPEPLFLGYPCAGRRLRN